MRIRIHALVAVAALTVAPLAFANHAIQVSKSVEINAPADKVWADIKDFGALQNWHPAVESTKIDKGGDNKPGTVRVLSLKGGGNITETLTAYSDKGRSMSYKINEGVLPVAGYSSTITVKAQRQRRSHGGGLPLVRADVGRDRAQHQGDEGVRGRRGP